MTRTLLAIVGVSLLLGFCGLVVSADPATPLPESVAPGGPAMLPESFIAPEGPLESLIEANGAWGLGANAAELEKIDLNLQLRPGLAIVLLTSVSDEMGFEFHRNPQEVLEWMKADAWFDKPAPVGELAATLRRLLAERAGEPGGEPAAS